MKPSRVRLLPFASHRSTTHTQRALLFLAGLGSVFAVSLWLATLTSPIARAQDPGFDTAMQTVVAKTVQVQRTRDAREVEAASQRLTTTAIENQQRQAIADATRTALAQQSSDAQATRSAAYVQATQTAVASATVHAANTTATAIASATSVEQTRSIEQARRDDATRTMKTIFTIQTASAQATQTAQARQTAVEERDANIRTGGTVAVIAALVSALVAVARLAWRTAHRPIVQVVADPAVRQSTTVNATDDTPPVVERIPNDETGEPIFTDEPENVKDATSSPTVPPGRLIIDDDLADQAHAFVQAMQETPVTHDDDLEDDSSTE